VVFIAIFIDVPFLFGFPLVFSYLTLKLIIDKRRLNFLIQIINIHFNLGFNQKKENGSGLYLLRKKENGKNELNLSFLSYPNASLLIDSPIFAKTIFHGLIK